jgi:hypothetical protein
MWDSISALIGVFLGVIIAIIFGWVSYNNRFIIFTSCAKNMKKCHREQYYEDPGNALADGANIDRLLFLNDKGQLYQHRRPKVICIPGSNQDKHIKRPQYCLFKSSNGTPIEGKNIEFDSSNYISVNMIEGQYIDIVSSLDCKPQSNTGPMLVTNGLPLIKWDENIVD